MTEFRAVDWLTFNPPVIDEYRATGGNVGGRWKGNPMLLLTTTGARSGRARTSPLTYTVHDGLVVVIASKAGAPQHPAWYHNIVANPDVTVELGSETYAARARIAAEPERSRLYDERIAEMPRFGEYRTLTDRVIPVVVLDRI